MHHLARRAVTVTAAAVLLLSAAASSAHAAEPSASRPTGTTVTLITGVLFTFR